MHGFVFAALGLVAPPPLQLPAPGRVVAVGDVHGDYRAFLQTLQSARLVDADAQWIGGDATLV